MTNNLLNKEALTQEIISSLQQNKFNVEKIADDNLKKALQNPSFKSTFEEIKDLTCEIGKLEFQKKDTKKHREKLTALQNKSVSILNKIGLTEQDIQPQYSCKKCLDSGFVNGKPCVCYNKKLSAKLVENNGVNKAANFKKANPDLWDSHVKDSNKRLFMQMKKYATDLKATSKKLVTICGNTGVGKTFLAQCIVNEAIDKGNYTIYISAFELNQQFLRYHCATVQEKSEIMYPFLSCDLLIIDDLGTESILQNVTREYLYLIISERNIRDKNTVITTNLMPNQIFDIYDERIYSRMIDKNKSLLIKMEGTDLRHKNKE